ARREGTRWMPLAKYLANVHRDPASRGRRTPEWDYSEWTHRDRDTLRLLELFPEAALCEAAVGVSVERQRELLDIGVRAAEEACAITEGLGDWAACACFLVLQARGHLETAQLKAACDCYTRARELYRELARARPGVYQPYLSMVLNNLGVVQQ